MQLAYMTAYLTRVKDFPPLRKLLIREAAPRVSERTALQGALAILSAQYGIPIVRRG